MSYNTVERKSKILKSTWQYHNGFTCSIDRIVIVSKNVQMCSSANCYLGNVRHQIVRNTLDVDIIKTLQSPPFDGRERVDQLEIFWWEATLSQHSLLIHSFTSIRRRNSSWNRSEKSRSKLDSMPHISNRNHIKGKGSGCLTYHSLRLLHTLFLGLKRPVLHGDLYCDFEWYFLLQINANSEEWISSESPRWLIPTRRSLTNPLVHILQKRKLQQKSWV